MSEDIALRFDLPSVGRKKLSVGFDGGQLSSDAGVLLLGSVERRLGLARRLSGCLKDKRDPDLILHTVEEMLRLRMFAIASGYEDADDCDSLRYDPIFKMAVGRLPESGDPLCSQPTMSRLENAPSKIEIARLMAAMVDQFCESYRRAPSSITLDIDDTFDAVHGGQQLRLFNAHYDEYGFQPIVVFDADGRFVTALLRPAKRPKGVEIRAFLRRLVRAIRSHWPAVEILLRADSHYACPEVMDWCETNSLDYILGLAPTRTLRRHITGLEESTAARFKAAPTGGKVRRFKEFFDAAKTWSRVRRIVARVEAGSDGTDTRFIVTNLGHGSGRSLYQDLYCRRGQAENHIKAWKTHLAADRTSCPKATANQFRLFLHAGAYWLLWSLRTLMPKRSSWRVAQFDTLRLRLIKTAARIVEMKTRIKIHLPSSAPDQAIWHLALGRLPRLIS